MNKFRNAAMVASASGVLMATAVVAPWEGLETKPYFDIVGVRTVCYGETQVEMREYTPAECEAMLRERVAEFYTVVDTSVTYDVPLSMKAAMTSFAYNVGADAFKTSTMVKKANRGDLYGACQELDRWVYASRMWVRGLAERRKVEKALCLADVKEGEA